MFGSGAVPLPVNFLSIAWKPGRRSLTCIDIGRTFLFQDCPTVDLTFDGPTFSIEPSLVMVNLFVPFLVNARKSSSRIAAVQGGFLRLLTLTSSGLGRIFLSKLPPVTFGIIFLFGVPLMDWFECLVRLSRGVM